MKDNLGTADTERALNLGAAGEKEVQQRLSALDLYKGPETGALDPATRSALAEWQKKSGFAPTSFLDSAQVAALKADSETEYQKYLAAQPASRAGRCRGAPPRFGQTFAEAPGGASGETFARQRRSIDARSSERSRAGARPRTRLRLPRLRGSRRESRLEARSGIAGTAD